MISIVVPVYKSEKTLGKCLESLMAQTYSDIEVICVVDGSPDTCGEICENYAAKDARIRPIQRENGGVSSARNRGIQEAKGEYLLFVDSDDTVEPDYCEKMVEAVEKTGAELVICGFHHWYVGRDVVKSPSMTGIYETGDYEKTFLKLYQEGFLNMPWNKLFRRKLAGSFDTSLSLGEDLLFNMDYLEKCEKVAVIPDALINYIQEEKGNTLSTKKRSNKLELAKRVFDRVQAYYEKISGKTEINPVIAGKFVMEFLDDCEKLPFDKESSKAQKLELIRKISEDQSFLECCRIAEVTAPDYKLLQWCFAKRLWRLIYPICVLRKGVVVTARWIWKH